MFGYVNIYKDELLVREFNQYKAVYCGLCRTLGKQYGIFSRCILSYDCTFYAVMLIALDGSCPGYEKKICRCNPLKKCTYLKEGSQALPKAAALSVSTVYYKLIDNINDVGGIKRFFYKILKSVAKRWYKKAEKRYPYICHIVGDMSRRQFEAESNPDCHLDLAAEPTAFMLAQLLSREGRTERDKLALKNLGYNLGRWIYLMDAADDLCNDKKCGNFNPFLFYDGEENIKDYCNQVLNECLAQAYSSWNLLSVTCYRGIIDNILLKGLAAKQRNVLFSEEEINDN